MDTLKIKQHIEIMKQILMAQTSLDKARKTNSNLIPHRGLRGGRATTRNANHSTKAAEVFEIEGMARDSAASLFGFCGLSFDVFRGHCMHNITESETNGTLWPDQCAYGGCRDDRFDCKIENCKILKSGGFQLRGNG